MNDSQSPAAAVVALEASVDVVVVGDFGTIQYCHLKQLAPTVDSTATKK